MEKRLVKFNSFIFLLLFPFITGFFTDYNFVKANKLFDAEQYGEAYTLYRKISDDVRPEFSQMVYMRLHEMQFNGLGTTRDINGSLRDLERVLDGPDANWRAIAKNKLAELYLSGEVVGRDPAKGIAYYESAAKEPTKDSAAHALFMLGSMYAYGQNGIIRDRLKALQFVLECNKIRLKHCESTLDGLKDYPEVIVALDPEEFAQNELGNAPAGMEKANSDFINGDMESAFRIFLWHARNGNAEAQLEVARMYNLGTGATLDRRKSNGWLYKSAKNGNASAQNTLGWMIFLGEVSGDDSESTYWLEMAVKQDKPDAMNNLAAVYMNPLEKDAKPQTDKALKLLERSAELGFSKAFSNLGVMYLDGLGVLKDIDRAKSFFFKAAEMGDQSARVMLYQHFGITFESASSKQLENHKTAKPKTKTASNKKYDDVLQPPAPTKMNTLEALSPVELYSRTAPSVYKIYAFNMKTKEQNVSQGSAVAISDDTVVTNCHVIKGMDAFGTKIGSDVVTFKVLKRAEKKDICILGTSKKLPPVTDLRDYSSIKVGEKVYAIGSPKGLENTLTEGLVSGLRDNEGVKTIQTSAGITNGSSGGGLFDAQGRLVGITSSGITGTDLNFAISSDEVMKILTAR